eukprot:4047404-Prymnesium_polylepis.1
MRRALLLAPRPTHASASPPPGPNASPPSTRLTLGLGMRTRGWPGQSCRGRCRRRCGACWSGAGGRRRRRACVRGTEARRAMRAEQSETGRRAAVRRGRPPAVGARKNER